MNAIKKLQEGNIFTKDSIVETYIEKNLWGTPVYKKSLLRVHQAHEAQHVEFFLSSKFV